MTVAVVAAISILFGGVIAISESAQQVQPTLNSTSANASYNMSVSVFTGVSQAGTGVVWGGIAAIVLVALGILVVAGRSGGR
jgi:hypothetical protein